MTTNNVTLEQIADPTFFQENRLPAHSDHRWYATPCEARRRQSSYEVCLDGVWKMHYAPNPAGAPEGFWAEDVDVTTWDDVPVPAHIQMLGYDRPQYANTEYPWDGHEDIVPGQIPTDYNPVASYVRSFTLPQALPEGERLVLRVEGAESNVVVWLNGHYVGYSEDTFTPSEFDLTPYVREGANRLALRVYKWCGGSWAEDQDFYRFSGLFRSVYLRRIPAVHVADVRVGVSLAQDLASAEVRVRTRLEGKGTVAVALEGAGQVLESEIADGVASFQLDSPHLWSAEDPFLYDLTLTVSDEAGQTVEIIPQKVGVRRFGIEDGVFKINGERIVFRGVNRHEFGEQGRVMTRERTEADLIALKRVGVNAIRTSHYPNNSFFYELADEYGFYVIDETNLESHGMWDMVAHGRIGIEDALPGNRPDWREIILDRARSMYERDKNHPSIVMWSCGNESFGGNNIADMADLFRSLDSRPVHYEGVAWDPRRPDTTDTVSQMYTPVVKLEEQLAADRSKPYILCEYAHAMGNSFGAVHKYFDLADRDPLFQGAFIWDFADQAIRRFAPDGTPFWGYGGDCGEAPHDGDFCGNGIFYADHTPSPKLPEVAHVYQGISSSFDLEAEEPSVTVRNRFLFQSTSLFDATVSVEREGRLLSTGRLITDVAPGESKSFALPVRLPRRGGEYTVTISFTTRHESKWAPAGFEIAWDQAVAMAGCCSTADGAPAVSGEAAACCGAAKKPAFALVSSVGERGLEVVNGGHNVGVHGEGFDVLFSRLTGALQSYRFGRTRDGGHEMLRGGVRPCFWHAPTANERGFGSAFEEGQWLLASRYSRPVRGAQQPVLEQEGEGVTVTYTYELAGLPGSTCTMAYRVQEDGTIEVTQVLEPAGEVPALPEFSTLIEVPGEFDSLTFYGRGPQETYVDRQEGARLGVYSTKVAEELPGYLTPQESGSHTGVRWAEVTDHRGRGLRVECAPGAPMEFSALPWTPFEVENALHAYELPSTGRTVLRPALMRRGVGGDDSWGARPHPEFYLPEGRLEFRFSLRGIM